MQTLNDNSLILKELTRFYKEVDIQVDNPMTSDSQIRNYHSWLLEKDLIRYVMPECRLFAYISYYRLSFEQLGRIVAHEDIDVYNEDLEHGPICWVTDVTIDPEFRHTWVDGELKRLFFEKNHNAKYFIGHAIYKKRSQPIRVFKATDFLKRYCKGVYHG